MSVIPLTTEGANRSVVTNQDDFNVDHRAVLMQGADLDQLTEVGASNVSYDLRIGQRYRDHKERAVKQLSGSSEVELRPGAAIIIETAESLHLPRMMYGSIAPKVSLLQKGLSTTYSKIDPGYHGHLLITLFNLGKTTVPLKQGDRFCALTLFEVGEGARLYDKESKQIDAEPARRGLRDRLEANQIYITLFVAIGTVLALFQPLITRVNYYKMAGVPAKLYGQNIGSSYQEQGLSLSKQFRSAYVFSASGVA